MAKTDGDDSPWPKKGDDPFGGGSNRLTNVDLDWFDVRQNDETIADGFKDAAEKVVERLEAGDNYPVHADRFFFPVAYLYRHCLELKMKCLLKKSFELELIELVDRDILTRHNLHKLWEKTREALEAFWPKGDKAELVVVEKSVLAFHVVDKSGQGFRYAEAKEGAPHLGRAPGTVDLARMRDVMAGVYNLLDGCSMAFDNAIECQREGNADHY